MFKVYMCLNERTVIFFLFQMSSIFLSSYLSNLSCMLILLFQPAEGIFLFVQVRTGVSIQVRIYFKVSRYIKQQIFSRLCLYVWIGVGRLFVQQSLTTSRLGINPLTNPLATLILRDPGHNIFFQLTIIRFITTTRFIYQM